MMTVSHPTSRTQLITASLLFAALLVFDLGIILFLADDMRVMVVDLVLPVNGVLTVILLFYVAWKIRPVSPGFAWAWFFLAMGFLAWTLGDFTWAVLEVFLKLQPFPSTADLFYMLYYPLAGAGLLLIPHEPKSLRGKITTGLDLSIVFVAAGLLYWNFLIGPVAESEGVDWLSFLISLAYPIFDLVLFAILMILIYRRRSTLSASTQALIVFSFGLLLFYDTVYGLQAMAGTYVSGTFLDLSGQIAFAACGLAGLFQLQSLGKAVSGNTSGEERASINRIDSWLTFFPYAWLAAAYGLLWYAQHNQFPMSHQAISMVIGVMIALILTRQVISIHERTEISEQLKKELTKRLQAQEMLTKSNNELEQRVQQRTQDLTEANQQLMNEVEERRRAEKLLEVSLHEKELLLKEIHHRVKNNLQVISSILMLQAGQIKDPPMTAALTDSQNRVQCMALIHEKLYQSPSLANVDFSGYIDSLVSFLAHSYLTDQKEVNLLVQAEPVSLVIDQAIPCGLIVNELVSNSLKHAFPNGNSGEVVVHLKAEKDGRVTLVVSDNGVGLPEGIDIRNSPSLGLQLVNALVGQLEGEIECNSSQGTKITISFLNTQPA